MATSTTLVVTNDFPPRMGGIETFVAQVCDLLDDDVVVVTSSAPGAASYDAGLDYEVIRRGRILLPTPTVGSAIEKLITERNITRVVFGAAAPLALLAGRARRAGAEHILALSHGHEVWWTMLPHTRRQIRKIANNVDQLGYISEFTRQRLAAVVRTADRDKLIRIPPPVDLDKFTPAGRREPGLVIAAGRFVTRKGFDVLLRVWPEVVKDLAELGITPRLELIGDGPQRRHLERLARGMRTVAIRAAVDHQQMAAELSRASVFALPVRERLYGLDAEGLGLVYAEAAACGVPVLVGNSGGAGDTVDEGRSGWMIDADDHHLWRQRLVQLLADPEQATSMGQAGRELVSRQFGAHLVQRAVREALDLSG